MIMDGLRARATELPPPLQKVVTSFFLSLFISLFLSLFRCSVVGAGRSLGDTRDRLWGTHPPR